VGLGFILPGFGIAQLGAVSSSRASIWRTGSDLLAERVQTLRSASHGLIVGLARSARTASAASSLARVSRTAPPTARLGAGLLGQRLDLAGQGFQAAAQVLQGRGLTLADFLLLRSGLVQAGFQAVRLLVHLLAERAQALAQAVQQPAFLSLAGLALGGDRRFLRRAGLGQGCPHLLAERVERLAQLAAQGRLALPGFGAKAAACPAWALVCWPSALNPWRSSPSTAACESPLRCCPDRDCMSICWPSALNPWPRASSRCSWACWV
jgi:hypothetical protein